jgi:hypothetical protein
MVDERDLGNRPVVDGLLPLMERRDAEKAELAKAVEGDLSHAIELTRRGEHLHAAALFESVSGHYRAKGFLGEAEAWLRRAADCRTVDRLRKRSGKGGGRR